MLSQPHYSYDGPYFPQYRPAQTRELYFMGRRWVQRTEIGPHTWRNESGQMVTGQGFTRSTWTFSNEGNFAAVSHKTREINAPRHPNR